MTLRLAVSGSGYLYVRDGHDSANERVYIHRLVAVAEHGFDAVRGRDVHHRDGVPENNSRDNLVPIGRAAHADMTLNGTA